MKIGVLSDTHGEISATQRAKQVLESQQVDFFLHCGDVGESVLPLLTDLTGHFVCGNTDDPELLRAAVCTSPHTLHEPIGVLELAGCQVAFLHGDDVKLLRHTIHSGEWDLVCHGHTHVFTHSKQGRTVVLNPGAVSRTAQPSLAVVKLPTMEVRQFPL